MAEKDLDKLELSLFKRKKKKDEPTPAAEAGDGGTPPARSDDTAQIPAAPASEPPAVKAPEPTREQPDQAPPARRAAPPEPGPVSRIRRPGPVGKAPSPNSESTPEPTPEPTRASPVAKAPEPTPATPAAQAAPAAPAATGASTAPPAEATSQLVVEQPEGEQSSETDTSGTSRPSVQLPALAPAMASLAVGAVVGLAAVALTFASLKGCELVTGTDSCGGPGLFVLIAVVTLMVLGGAAALRNMDVPDAGGLSFLGVAMFVAVCLVVLLPSLLEPWMVFVAPVLCAITFALAHWIVSRFDEDTLEREGPEPHDVR